MFSPLFHHVYEYKSNLQIRNLYYYRLKRYSILSLLLNYVQYQKNLIFTVFTVYCQILKLFLHTSLVQISANITVFIS